MLDSVFSRDNTISTQKLSNSVKDYYIHTILQKSEKYLKSEFNAKQYKDFMNRIKPLYKNDDMRATIESFERIYYDFVKELYQNSYPYDKNLENFLAQKQDKKIIWGDCLKVLKQMKSESIGCMVTSPPYYNARDYAQWENLEQYLLNMEVIIKECYRVLDNHRVFVFNVGDIFDNDNLIHKKHLG